MIGIFIVGLLIALTIILNYLIYKVIVFIAVRKFIIPHLKKYSLDFIEVKFCGFLNTGDFGKHTSFSPFVQKMGNIKSNTYVFVFAQKKNKEIIKLTAKIQTTFFFVRNVEYRGL